MIILLSSCITGITGLSTSAIATNGKVKGGLCLCAIFVHNPIINIVISKFFIHVVYYSAHCVLCFQVGPTS